jgi:hypothetical protein
MREVSNNEILRDVRINFKEQVVKISDIGTFAIIPLI